ncbi:MAG TPA: hypothetical protein VFZ66_17100 [Herpetosiphonaceae bacterium]
MHKHRPAAWPISIVVVALLGLASSSDIGSQAPGDRQRADSDKDASKSELRVLFIGNSLTYSNDMPAIVEALAKASGERRLVHKTIASGGVGLEDHWHQGPARKTIAQGSWDVVVLQQGPSALPESRTILLDYSRRFAEEIRRAGARPALYMVWPATDRFRDFDRASESYQIAAKDIQAMLFPAGEAWRAAWRRDARAALYSRDGLHPSVFGSYLTALVVYEQLYGSAPTNLPPRLTVQSRSVRQIELRPDQIELLRVAAQEANQKFGRR